MNELQSTAMVYRHTWCCYFAHFFLYVMHTSMIEMKTTSVETRVQAFVNTAIHQYHTHLRYLKCAVNKKQNNIKHMIHGKTKLGKHIVYYY